MKPEKVEAGTGFFEHRFVAEEKSLPWPRSLSRKSTRASTWEASLEYSEDIIKMTPHEGTPLKLDKKLFKRRCEERRGA